ncbi:hypothetical protein Tco_0692149 [Tanacetum coccineum]
MFLGSDMNCDMVNTDGLFVKHVSGKSSINMVKPVSDKEIKAAMFSIGDDRAPGDPLSPYSLHSLLGGVESARVIMEALKEFKCTSGLVPSLPKSMTFFCNVSNHVKLAILSIMPFSEGDLPVKYLGVPLISLQLCSLVLSSMHVYWASVLMLPKGIIYDIQSLIHGFLWCNALNLDVHSHDAYRWRGLNRSFSDFLVSRAWDAFRPRGNECSTRFSAHLFFECAYSSQVWKLVRPFADMESVQPILHDIISYIQPMAHKRKVGGLRRRHEKRIRALGIYVGGMRRG